MKYSHDLSAKYMQIEEIAITREELIKLSILFYYKNCDTQSVNIITPSERDLSVKVILLSQRVGIFDTRHYLANKIPAFF